MNGDGRLIPKSLKWFGVLFVFLILVLNLIWVFIYRERVVYEESSKAEFMAAQAEERINEFFEINRASLETFSQGQVVGQTFDDFDGEASDLSSKVYDQANFRDIEIKESERLLDFMRQNKSIERMEFVSSTGVGFLRVNSDDAEVERVNMVDRDFFKIGLEMRGGVYVDGRIIEEGKKRLVRVLVPVDGRSPGSVSKGMILATLRVDDLLGEILAELNSCGQDICGRNAGWNYSLRDSSGIELYGEIKGQMIARAERENSISRWDFAVAREESKIWSELEGVVKFNLILGTILVFVGIISSVVILNLIKNRLIDLTQKLDRLRKSGLGERLVIEERDEIGEIEELFNLLIENYRAEVSQEEGMIVASSQKEAKEAELLGLEQKKIYDEREKLSYVMENVKDGIVLLDKNRRIVRMNKRGSELIGFGENEVRGRVINELVKFWEKEREILIDEYLPVGSMNNQAFKKKYVRLTGDQTTTKLIELLCLRLDLLKAQDLGYMMVLHDMGEEEKIGKRQNELLGAFVREIRQPEYMLSNYFQIFAKKVTEDGSGARTEILKDEDLLKVQAGIAHMNLVMENLQIVEVLENGQLVVGREEVDMGELVRHAIGALGMIAKERQVEIVFEEKSGAKLRVITDEDRMYQVILNLLLNGINFTKAGGVVKIELREIDAEVILQIQDSGVGIASEDMPNIYNKFWSKGGEGVSEGIGLGLYLSKALMEKMNGKIWIDSVEGRGSVASISLSS